MMKKALLVLIVLIPLLNFAQKREIPEIPWPDTSSIENPYVNLLGLKDTNFLIIKFGCFSHWSNGQNSKFLIFQNNGSVKTIKIKKAQSSRTQPKTKLKNIKKRELSFFWDLLLNCADGNKFQIDKSKLNINQKKGEQEGTTEILGVYDGNNYYFEMWQGKNHLSYTSYAPESFIENKYPGWEERQKLLDLIESFEKLIGKKKTN